MLNEVECVCGVGMGRRREGMKEGGREGRKGIGKGSIEIVLRY